MKLTIMTAVALAATAGFGNVFLYECEKFKEKEITVSGEKGKFIWVDGGPVMLPGGYSSIGIMSDKGSKAVVDCVIVTDEDGFRPPMDEGGLKKLHAENTKE